MKELVQVLSGGLTLHEKVELMSSTGRTNPATMLGVDRGEKCRIAACGVLILEDIGGEQKKRFFTFN